MIYYLTVFVFIFFHVDGSGCIRKVCEGNTNNDLRDCPDSDGTCGTYHGKRKDGRIVNGVDIKCQPNAIVYSPFDGEMTYWRPFGGRGGGHACADHGARIEGTGQWQGYFVLIASLSLDFYGGPVKEGQAIGKAIGQACIDEMGGQFQDFIQMRMYKQGKLVDPTSHINECSCTGQICESNPTNKLVGKAFKTDSRFNGVRGWDIQCGMIENSSENEVDVLGEFRSPWIYSPIDGELIGRIRLRYDREEKYNGCDNDGVFVVGTGAWIDYEVRIYNVQFRGDLTLGKTKIEQGQPIARRLTCKNSADSIYLEARHHGKIVDISELLLSKNCKLPDFSSIV